MSGADKRKKRREGLWKEQGGLCHWCSVPMIHWNDRASDPGKQTPEMRLRWATIEHMRSRLHVHRNDGNPNREQRWTLACWKCNHDRGRAEVLAIPIEERQLAARAFPRGKQPYFIKPAMRR